MRLALAMVALLASPAESKQTLTTSSVGAFSITTKVDDLSETPIMHAPLVTKEVSLEWRTTDGRALFSLHDSGRDLTASYGFAKPGGRDLVCGSLGGGKLLQYPTEDAAKQWFALERDWLVDLTKSCGSVIDSQQLANYDREFHAAAVGFFPAIAKMKAAAQEQFGGWRRRCLDYKHVKSTWADMRCVRQSAKEN